MRPKTQKGSNRHTKNPPSEKAARLNINSRFDELYDKIRDGVKEGNYEAPIKTYAVKLYEIIKDEGDQLLRNDEVKYLKALSSIYDVYDYYELPEAAEVVKEGQIYLRTFQTGIGEELLLSELILIRERLRVALDYCNATFYRQHHHKKASEEMEKLKKVIEAISKNKDVFPCWGSWGQLHFYLGRVQRALGQVRSIHSFSESLRCYQERVAYKQKQLKDDPKGLRLATTFSMVKSAIALGVGIGFCNISRSRLREALYQNVLPAANLLALCGSGDIQNLAMLNLLQGSILRQIAGYDENGLQKAKKAAEQACITFQKTGHRRWFARALYEIAAISLYEKNFADAESKINKVEEIARETNNERWLANAYILRSRIWRKKAESKTSDKNAAKALYAEAIDLATQGIERANDELSCQIEGYITRAKASIQLGNYSDAHKDLEVILDISCGPERTEDNVNPRVAANVYLEFCRSAVRQGNLREARNHFDKWKQLEAEVEHGGVHALAKKVESELTDTNQNILLFQFNPLDTESEMALNYRANLEKLQDFLIKQAKRVATSDVGVADLLGVSRQT